MKRVKPQLGDGFESESTVVEGHSAARVFLDQIVDRYQLPMTISVIVAGLTDDYAITPIAPGHNDTAAANANDMSPVQAPAPRFANRASRGATMATGMTAVTVASIIVK